MTDRVCYIDFAAGDQDAYDDALRRYKALVSWLVKNGPKYGLASRLADLDEAGQETLTAVYSGDTQVRPRPGPRCLPSSDSQEPSARRLTSPRTTCEPRHHYSSLASASPSPPRRV